MKIKFYCTVNSLKEEIDWDSMSDKNMIRASYENSEYS